MSKRAIRPTMQFLFQFVAIPFVITSTWAKPPSTYPSPDGALVATVVWVPALSSQIFECRIIITSKSGKELGMKDLTSPDHDHGGVVEKAAWSPDSQFFVFTHSSSGGHSPWHVPTGCYRRWENRFESLDDFIGFVADSNFSFKPPHNLTIKVWKRGPDGETEGEIGVPKSVSLSQVFGTGIPRQGAGLGGR